MAIPDDLPDGFVAKQDAVLRMKYFTALEKNDPIRVTGINVQRAGLARLGKYLNYAGQIEMRKVAAQCGFGTWQHLRWLKTLLAAEQKTADVLRRLGRRSAPVDQVAAAGPIGLEQSLLAAAADGNQREVRCLRIRAKNQGHLERSHFAEIRGAKDRGGSAPFKHGERVRRLCSRDDFKSKLFQRVAEPLDEVHVAINQQDARSAGRSRHGPTSSCFAPSPPGGCVTRASRSRTSIRSSPTATRPLT